MVSGRVRVGRPCGVRRERRYRAGDRPTGRHNVSTGHVGVRSESVSRDRSFRITPLSSARRRNCPLVARSEARQPCTRDSSLLSVADTRRPSRHRVIRAAQHQRQLPHPTTQLARRLKRLRDSSDKIGRTGDQRRDCPRTRPTSTPRALPALTARALQTSPSAAAPRKACCTCARTTAWRVTSNFHVA